MVKKKNESQDNVTEGIAQIREIIFGEQSAEINRQLQELKKECNTLTARLIALEGKNENLTQVVTQDGKRIDHSESDRQNIYEVIEQLKTEFEKKLKELTEKKVDKSQIGQAFIEWGMKVKQETNQEK